jgi:Phosphoesterase family
LKQQKGGRLENKSRKGRKRIAAGAIASFAVCVALLPGAIPDRAQKSGVQPAGHFERVLIVVLENQNYDSARKDPYLAQLARQGANFTNFRAIAHPSYPNYLAMVAGSSFGVRDDDQIDFPDDPEHGTVANYLDWRSYAEDYPTRPIPFLKDRGKYARKHVPLLSFSRIQRSGADRVVPVDPSDPRNRFVRDIQNFRSDPKKYPLPQYMFYTPNLDNDGHDPSLDPPVGLRKASRWLSNFLENWCPLDDKMKGTLVVVTFDESDNHDRINHIYTVFLGDMVKHGDFDEPYSHYNVLKTVEDNFQIPSFHASDREAQPITGIWK